jgi:thiosulfate dehydrogenase
VTSAVHAYPDGPPAGYSGGPANLGAACPSCHEFNLGTGTAKILGAPRRYRPGDTYDLTILISDSTQAGAGFQLSAECDGGHVGSLEIVDPLLTQYAMEVTNYVTHTQGGVDESLNDWIGNGGSYGYGLRWQSPESDDGCVALFASSLAVNDGTALNGDNYYFHYVLANAGVDGDYDGDRDVDLVDFAGFQTCFSPTLPEGDEACAFLDVNRSGVVDLVDLPGMLNAASGPTALDPPEYVLADPVRGGMLYDKWWAVNGAPEPSGNHPLYPDLPFQSGSTTYRCKECHGWDYLGVDGAYGTGFHYTGIGGIAGTTLSSREVFALLVAGTDEDPKGHDMLSFGLQPSDVWDLVKMTLEGVTDTTTYIDGQGVFIGSAGNGAFTYQDTCQQCHGSQGNAIPDDAPVFLGAVATDNPWEFMHKVRFSHPGAAMIPGILLELSDQDVADLGAYVQMLPKE